MPDPDTAPSQHVAPPASPAIEVVIGERDQQVRVADGRLSVRSAGRTVMDVAIGEVRRIQFDLEQDRPATLVIVPQSPRHEPQVVAIPPDHFAATGAMLAWLGHQLLGWGADQGDGR